MFITSEKITESIDGWYSSNVDEDNDEKLHELLEKHAECYWWLEDNDSSTIDILESGAALGIESARTLFRKDIVSVKHPDWGVTYFFIGDKAIVEKLIADLLKA